MADIYEKLQKIRTAVNKENTERPFKDFEAFKLFLDKKLNSNKVLPLYTFYENRATLALLDMDNTESAIDFDVPVELVGVRHAKRFLYQMAFDVEIAGTGKGISIKEYVALFEKMTLHNVTEKEILERYSLDKMESMTPDIYQRCMRVFENMSK